MARRHPLALFGIGYIYLEEVNPKHKRSSVFFRIFQKTLIFSLGSSYPFITFFLFDLNILSIGCRAVYSRKGEPMSVRTLAVSLALAGLSLASATSIALASDPSGTGQPSASCQNPSTNTQPNGFTTVGFTHATSVYAGSPGSASLNSYNSAAVSQYDVACFQLSTH